MPSEEGKEKPGSVSFGYGVKINKYAHRLEIVVNDSDDLADYLGAVEMILAEMNARMIRVHSANRGEGER